jgi:colanic acid biosynthesis protein WcaH
MLDEKAFKTVVDLMPLISIDIILMKNNKILLGRRNNKPAQGYFFTTGGRVKKNETLNSALDRIAKDELNVVLKLKPKFLGIFEHFYNDSIYENVSTHYVNLAYIYEVQEINSLPTEQHSEYRWFGISELKENKHVHKYVKDYFKG